MNLSAGDIKALFREHWRYRFFECGLFEFGASQRNGASCQFDVFMIQPNRQVLKGFEIKVSRSDFLSDLKERERLCWGGTTPIGAKWKTYLKFCHLFYWVCPEGLIKPEEVQDPAGLIYVRPDEKSQWFQVMKKPKRINRDMPVELLQRILFLFAARGKVREGSYF
jgi:hypothetical protein